MKTISRITGNSRGVALITMMLLLSALTIMAVGAVMVSEIDMKLAGNYYQNSRAFYAAEAGVEKALSDLQSLLDGQGKITDSDLATILPPDLDDFSFEEFSLVRSDSSFVDTIDTGPYMGMVSLNQPIDITSKVTGPRSSRYSVLVGVEGLQIPIFQFGVFYDDDLEIHNGAAMTFVGRVHTNGDLYLGTGASTDFYDNITIAGDLYRYRKFNGETFGGSIGITHSSSPAGPTVALTYDSDTYAGNDEGFVAQTTADFGAHLKTRAHNITPLGLPIPNTLNPRDILEPRDVGDGPAMRTERLDWQADTRIYINSSLTTVSITDNSGSPKFFADPSALNTIDNLFYDGREEKNVDVLEIDVSKLTAADLDNGIIYVSIEEDGTDVKAVKLVSASSLPAPMTVATENALYIDGSYNTAGWEPSAVMADAVYLLSDSWNDSKTNGSLPGASSTTYYVAILSGDTPNSTAYNGGLENFPRFEENWSGQTCTIYGSFINLFLCEQADAQWSYGGDNYTAPNRNWNFDVRFLDFNNLPPGTPSVGSVLRIAFRQEFYL